METIQLNNGIRIPQLGLGVYMIDRAETCRQNVLQALDIGYRHIDTAQVYRNEQWVGEAVAASGLDRCDVFLTSKVWTSNYGYQKCLASIERSLNRLRTDYIDLMLLHRPFGDTAGAWQALEAALAAGKVRAIGLSNFVTEAEWEQALAGAKVRPAVNQVEAHPYAQRRALKERMAREQIALEAWYPLGHGSAELLHEPLILRLAKAHGKSPAQIILRWHIQEGHIIFPKSLSPDHLRDNFNIFDFSLTDAEMLEMAALDRQAELFRSVKWIDQIMYRWMKV